LSLSRLGDVNQRLLWVLMAGAVIVIWLVGAAVTKFSLEQMAYFAPLAVLVVGATVALVVLWVKVIRDSLGSRRGTS
jgi:uncharacterized membrane protein YiaA